MIQAIGAAMSAAGAVLKARADAMEAEQKSSNALRRVSPPNYHDYATYNDYMAAVMRSRPPVEPSNCANCGSGKRERHRDGYPVCAHCGSFAGGAA